MVRVDVPDQGPQLAQVHPVQPVPEHPHRAPGRMDHRAEQPQQGRLPRAVGAEQRPVLTGPDGQGDLLG